MISSINVSHFNASDDVKWLVSFPPSTVVDSDRSNSLPNMHQHCQPSFSLLSTLNLSGIPGSQSHVAAAMDNHQPWHGFVGQFLHHQSLPPGFWRQLADSPSRPCASNSAPPAPSVRVPSCCCSLPSPFSASLTQLATIRQPQKPQQFVLTSLPGQLALGIHFIGQQANNSTFLNDLIEFGSRFGDQQQNGQIIEPLPILPGATIHSEVGGGAEMEEDEQLQYGVGGWNAGSVNEVEEEEEAAGDGKSVDKLLLHAVSSSTSANQPLRLLLSPLHQLHFPVSSAQMTVESFGKMPELERQEVGDTSLSSVKTVDLSSASFTPDSGDVDENVYPPQLDAEETMEQRPILPLPKRLLEISMGAITTVQSKTWRPRDRDVPSSCHPLPPSSVCCFSRCSSADNVFNGSTTDDKRKSSRKYIMAGKEQTEDGDFRRDTSRKRRRGRMRIGQRRKRRGNRHKMEKDSPQERLTEAKLYRTNVTLPPPKTAFIRVPKQTQKLLGCKGSMTTHRKRQSTPFHKRTMSPLLPIVSNWRPIGPGCLRRPFPASRDTFLCFDAIRHRTMHKVGIRIGNCVQIHSADSEDDLFVARVVCIHYQPEDHSLQLTLLWFYTRRQLPSAAPLSEPDDPRELFASKHLDSVNADSVDALTHVLTFAEYCRYRAELAIRRMPNGRTLFNAPRPCPRSVANYPRRDFLPLFATPSDTVFFCRGVFSLSKKRIISFRCAKPIKLFRGFRPRIAKSSAD